MSDQGVDVASFESPADVRQHVAKIMTNPELWFRSDEEASEWQRVSLEKAAAWEASKCR